jgi:predicted transcriptional regulator
MGSHTLLVSLLDLEVGEMVEIKHMKVRSLILLAKAENGITISQARAFLFCKRDSETYRKTTRILRNLESAGFLTKVDGRYELTEKGKLFLMKMRQMLS